MIVLYRYDNFVSDNIDDVRNKIAEESYYFTEEDLITICETEIYEFSEGDDGYEEALEIFLTSD